LEGVLKDMIIGLGLRVFNMADWAVYVRLLHSYGHWIRSSSSVTAFNNSRHIQKVLSINKNYS